MWWGPGVMQDLSVSVVTYHPPMPMLADTLTTLRGAVEQARLGGVLGQVDLALVDNGDDPGLLELAHSAGWPEVRVVSGQGNVGFGRGHNLALAGEVKGLHLILNPDVELAQDSLLNAVRFMAEHPDCGLLSPAVRGKEGSCGFLCKRYPTLLDLFLRGFMPMRIRRLFSARLKRYEMDDCADREVLWDPPIVSGCFMLVRGSLLRELGGFDARYFLYFEDFDFSLKAARCSRLAAVRAVGIAHHGGDAARKGWAHVRMFCTSAWKFFSRHGWRWV